MSVALAAIWSKKRGPDIESRKLSVGCAKNPPILPGNTSTKAASRLAQMPTSQFSSADREWTVTEDRLYFRNKISPYLGQHFTGQVKATFVRGRLVYDDGRFPAEPAGRECRVNRI